MRLIPSKSAAGYLNTASFGLPPDSTIREVTNVIREWADGRLLFGAWLERARLARAAIARLLDVGPEWVVLGSSSAPLLSAVAASLPDGARVLAPLNEHNSNLIPYLNQAHRGVRVECVPLPELAARVIPGISVVSCSAVQSLTGERADLDAIGGAAHDAGALFCLDISQACGWLPVNGTAADVIVCSIYKWLCSPIGGAFLVMRPDLAGRFRPVIPGWISGADVMAAPYGADFSWATGPRKLDTVPNLISMIGLQASIETILELGTTRIYEHNVTLANRFRAGLGLSPSNSAIVSVTRPGASAQLAKAGIRTTEWQGKLRVSFHFYNSEEDVDEALQVLVAQHLGGTEK
jgi:selenocysteine lyase/cysteine desulfurase